MPVKRVSLKERIELSKLKLGVLYRIELGYVKFEKVLVVKELQIIRESPYSWTVLNSKYYKKIVYKNASKQYASPTIKEAESNYMHRTNRRVALLAIQLENAQLGQKLIREKNLWEGNILKKLWYQTYSVKDY